MGMAMNSTEIVPPKTEAAKLKLAPDGLVALPGVEVREKPAR